MKRTHFERFVGDRVKIKVRGPLVPGDKQRTFHGHIQATEADPHQPDDPRAGSVVIRPLDGEDLVTIPLRRISRANLVYV